MNGTQAIPVDPVTYRVPAGRLVFPALIVGAIALAVAIVIGVFHNFGTFLHAYLAAWLFWVGLTLGCTALTMLYHLTGGRWGDVLRPLLETGAKLTPLVAILGIPILLGMSRIYPWAQPVDELTRVVKVQHERWMNGPFFTIRYVLYFALWTFFAFALNRRAKERDDLTLTDPSASTSGGFRVLSGPGLALLCITITLALVDWAMSTQRGWFSTIYGLAFLAGQGLSTFAFMTATMMLITRAIDRAGGHPSPAPHDHGHGHEGDVGPLQRGDWHDLGNLLLAFTMLWTYMNLSQFLITWSGNLPQETIFYRQRLNNGWQYVGWFLLLFHFALPFALLLSRGIKRDWRKLGLVALLILLVRQVDFYYQIQPSYARFPIGGVLTEHALGWHTLANLLTPIGIGGIWIAAFVFLLQGRRVLPVPIKGGHGHG